MTERQKVAGELLAVAKELTAADNAVYEVIDEVTSLQKMLYKHLKNFGLEGDRNAKRALKALGDATSFMREIPNPK